MDQETLLGVLTAFTMAQRQMLLTLEALMNDNKRLPQTPYDTRHRIRQLAYFWMIHESDLVCRESTRMDRRTLAILCHLLRTVSSLSSTEIVDVEKMVAMFLHVFAHDVKNRVIQREFVRFGETVSQHFNIVLLAVVRLYKELIKRPAPVTNNCNDQRWKGQRYHLQEWRGAANAPTNAKEYFNMKHSSARNVIEHAFDVLKGRWAILRGKSYYPLQVQCRTILACALLHNLINKEMTSFEDVDDVDEGDSTYATTIASEDIHYIETTNEWSQWRDDLAKSMFTDWQLRNA
ncbi:hypothetical protein IC582_011064 [Cucumis melo]